MIFFLLPETQSGISEAHVGEIVFHGRTKIFLPFHVIAAGFIQKECILEITQIPLNGSRIDTDLLFTEKSIGQFRRVRQGADGRCNDIQKIIQYRSLILDTVPFHHISEIGPLKEILQIPALFFMGLQ